MFCSFSGPFQPVQVSSIFSIRSPLWHYGSSQKPFASPPLKKKIPNPQFTLTLDRPWWEQVQKKMVGQSQALVPAMGALQMEPTGLEMERQQQGADEEHLPRERLVLGGGEVMDCYWVSWELLLTLQHLQARALALIAQEQ
jgi:hypothetical protein